jgi:hypothetical protein
MISYLFEYLLLLGSPNSCFGPVDTWEGKKAKSIDLLFRTQVESREKCLADAAR